MNSARYLVALTLLAAGCAAKTLNPEVPPSSEVPPSAPPAPAVVEAPPAADAGQEIEIKQTLDQNLPPTGRLTLVTFNVGQGLIGSALAEAFAAQVREAMVAKGFVTTTDPAKAHVHLAIAAYHPNETTWGLKLVGFVNAHGKRPAPWFDQTAEMHVSLAERWDTFSGRVLAGLSALEIKAPAQDQKMKGPPGCTPRFGFETTTVTEDARQRYQIAKVAPKSPAARAGVRVGDVLEAIDSLDYETFSVGDREVYESRITVPDAVKKGRADRADFDSGRDELREIRIF